jgi:hypothetical protein
MALVITKAYAAKAILFEAHIDNFRNALHTLFNTTKFDSTFFSSLTLTSANFSGTAITLTDNTYLTFGASHDGQFGLDASQNLVFDTVGVKPIKFKAVSFTLDFRSTQVNLPGDIIGKSGGAGRSMLQLLSLYKKPVIEYYDPTRIKIQNNSPTGNETLLILPLHTIAITEAISADAAQFRVANFSNTANGYNSSHTGAARGGRRVGLDPNVGWYYVYAVRVQGGTDAGNKFIMVFDNTPPIADNDATLDSYYTNGMWVYLGMIRYGFGPGFGSKIIPFQYSNKGWCEFTDNDGGSAYCGLTLKSDSVSADGNPYFTLTQGEGATNIPAIINQGRFSLARDKVTQWAARDTINAIFWEGGWQDVDTTVATGHLIQLPIYAGMNFTHTRHDAGAAATRVVLAAFHDSYIAVRLGGRAV